MSHFFEIDQYLHGELSEQERVAFEQRLQVDSELRKALESQQKMELTLKEISTEKVVREVGQKYKLIRRKRRTFLLVTASFVGLFLLFWYGQNLIAPPTENDLTSINEDTEQLVLSLYDKYNNLANEADALEPLQRIASRIPIDPNQVINRIKPFAGKNKKYDYYYAHARFKTGEYEEARQAFARFRALITEADPLFQSYQFFNLLNTILLEEPSTYQAQLEALLDQEEHEYRTALLELYEGLAELEG